MEVLTEGKLTGNPEKHYEENRSQLARRSSQYIVDWYLPQRSHHEIATKYAQNRSNILFIPYHFALDPRFIQSCRG